MERDFHRWLEHQTSSSPAADSLVRVGIGDDAAILHGLVEGHLIPGLVLATDAIAEGTHFDLSRDSLQQIGRKSLGVNLSDIAAMGAKPLAALITFMLPRAFSLEQAQELFGGAKQLADDFQVAIVGGDTNRWEGSLVISVTVIGFDSVAAQGKPTWRLGGAKLGDRIVVSGSFGGSILGKHLRFQPRIELAQYLASRYRINGATDVSDSLSLDLSLMAGASAPPATPRRNSLEDGLGVELFGDKIPLADAALQLSAQTNKTPLEHALTDGEDFELLLAVEPPEFERMKLDPMLQHDPMRLTEIGSFVSRPGFWLRSENHCQPFEPRGYSH